jgi:DNA primase
MQIPRLHPDTLEEVKQRADIVDVISEYVVLRKRGKDFLGLCPFHNEKSPSFSVSPAKQMYHCFGCQTGGNAIKFLMEIGKASFSEVVLDLARRYQVPVQTLEPEQRQELQRQLSLRDQLFEIIASASQFYQHALRQNQGKAALDYITSKRQLKEEAIQQFSLGYAPAGWETIYKYLTETKGYPVQLVEKAGLIKPRKEGNGYYDVFRDRLMIPISDIMGRAIAFGGRTLGDEQPKYLNSPETELFNKGKILFALDKAKNGISQQDQAIVVEGYFDVIALHAAGITNVVASLGTALSLDQVKLLLRYSDSKQLILNFDADKAGTNAASKAIGEISDLAYKGEVNLKILNIPDGKDADEYLYTHSAEDYRQLAAAAPLWLDWQIQQITKDKDLKQAVDFQLVSQQFVKLLKEIVNKDTLSYYVSHCAEILSQGNAMLTTLRVENLLTQVTSKTAKPFQGSYQASPTSKNKWETKNRNEYSTTSNPNNPSYSSEATPLEAAEVQILCIYLHFPEQRQEIINTLEERDLQFNFSHHRFLWQLIVETPHDQEKVYTTIAHKDLIASLQDRYSDYPEQMESISHLFHLNEKIKRELMRIPHVVQAAFASIEIVIIEKRYRHFLEKWQQTDPKSEPELYHYYYQAFDQEKKKLIELSKLRQFSVNDFI